MKDLLRLKTSLTEEIETALNAQVKLEANSSATYLAMAAWCDRNGFDNSATFFYNQSDEERKHMLKIFKYISDLGGHAVSPDLKDIPQEYNSFREVFEKALEQEIQVTQAINKIMDKCHKVKDYSTATFLQWFMTEQIEEEYVARRALELFDVIGEEGVGRFMIDKQIPKISYEEK